MGHLREVRKSDTHIRN